MHVRDLVEVAAVVALNGPLIIRGAASFSPARLDQYWATSKCRVESWHRALKCAAPNLAECYDEEFDNRIQLRATLDEIFVGEMLTRVWSAVLVGHDRLQHCSVDGPIARNVLVSHVEARHRALSLLLDADGFSPRQALAIDRTRRRAERWTDVLIGGLLGACDVSEFAVQAERAVDFADDLSRRRAEAGGCQSWRLTLVSLRAAFGRELCPVAANPEANARITASILGCFPDELFDSTGLLQPVWMMRLAAVASDAQGMIDDLLGGEPSPPARRPALPRGRRR
jgi:hypothetical protein